MTLTIHDHFPSIPEADGAGTSEKLLVICDFDGTVCRLDMCNAILEHFAGDWDAIDRNYATGEIGSRAAYGKIAPLVRANRQRLLDFILTHEQLDPFFPEFLHFCRGRGIDVKIVSDGLDIYITAILEKHGLAVESHSNRVVFPEEDRIEVDFPPASPECGRCGNCKRSLIDRFRTDYDRIFYVGDGHSDICAARTADWLFAKDVLYEKCMENGTPCIHYGDFGDVRRHLAENLEIKTASRRK